MSLWVITFLSPCKCKQMSIFHSYIWVCNSTNNSKIKIIFLQFLQILLYWLFVSPFASKKYDRNWIFISFLFTFSWVESFIVFFLSINFNISPHISGCSLFHSFCWPNYPSVWESKFRSGLDFLFVWLFCFILFFMSYFWHVIFFYTCQSHFFTR